MKLHWAMTEMQGAPVWVVHILGLMLLLGRVMHGWGMSQSPQNLPAREYGMMLALAMIAFTAIANIGHVLF